MIACPRCTFRVAALVTRITGRGHLYRVCVYCSVVDDAIPRHRLREADRAR